MFCVTQLRATEEVKTLDLQMTSDPLFNSPLLILVFEYICAVKRLPWDYNFFRQN